MTDWHENLKRLMKARGLKASRLSKKAGLSHAFVKNVLDRESYPSVENAARIAGVLNVSLDELYYGAGNRADREHVIARLSDLIEHIYGPRCDQNEGGCMCCLAWANFDVIVKLTDAPLLDETDEGQATKAGNKGRLQLISGQRETEK